MCIRDRHNCITKQKTFKILTVKGDQKRILFRSFYYYAHSARLGVFFVLFSMSEKV